MKWLNLFRWGKSPPRPQPPKVVSAVFIDVANIVNRRLDPKTPERFWVAWQTLRELIAKDTEGTQRTFAKAYSSMEINSERRARIIAEERTQWHISGYEFDNDSEEDVDAVIRTDMRAWINRNAVQYPTSKLRIVLVSGDGGFIRVLANAMKAHPNRIELYVWSWRAAFNASFLKFTSRTKVRYIDAHPEAILYDPIEP